MLKGGGAAPAAVGAAPPGPAPSAGGDAPAADAAAERIRQAEQGLVHAGGAKKALSAASKLKNLKL
jgi:hypothetical protein